MKVLHCMWSAELGGIERLVLDLAYAQRKDGLDVEVLVGKYKGEFLDDFDRDQTKVHSLDLRSGFQYSRRKVMQAVELMDNFDIVHLHAYNPIMASAALKSKKIVVHTEHGNFGFGRKVGIRDRIKYWLTKTYLKKVNFVSFNSAFTKNCAESKYGLKSINRRVVYNGIRFGELGPFEDSKSLIPSGALPADQFVIGTTSRFAGFKRVDRLVNAFHDFARDKPDVKLLLVGDGPTRQSIEELVEKLEVGHKTIFTGFQKQVASFQNAMDVCVFASENEPFGLVAVETLRIGKPTVVFRSGGIAEIVEPLCPDDVVDSIEQLTARLDYYYKHKQKTNDLDDIRKNYSRRFCISKMSSEFASIYSEISGA